MVVQEVLSSGAVPHGNHDGRNVMAWSVPDDGMLVGDAGKF